MEDETLVGILGLARRAGGSPFEDPLADQRCRRHRRHPAQAQRDEDDSEEAATVLARGVVRSADGGERDDGDDGGPEQRCPALADDVGRCVRGILSGLDLHLHSLDDHDRVVDEHAERDDQRPQGDAFERHGEDVHEEERSRDRQEQDAADEQAAAHAHEDQQHDDYDDHGFEEVHHEAVDGQRHGRGLHRDDLELHPQGRLVLELLQPDREGVTHRDDVAAPHRRDPDADSGLAVEADQLSRRIDVAARDRRHVLQEDQAVSAAGADQQLAELLLGGVLARRVDGEVLRLEEDAPCVGRQVLG